MQPLHHDDLKQIDGYKLIARLGQGGMGVVYYARRYDGTLVALKVITPRFANSESYKKRFEHEIKNALKVDSPYVAKVFDYNLTGDVWWYASEYAAGVTIEEAVMRAGGSLPDETIRKLVYDLGWALQEIHANGIVHRDLKPQNVILGPTGIKVIDFGIAHSTDGTRLTTTDGIIGTPAYMCPEQLRGAKPNFAWDIFALGGLIVYAASGHPPYSGEQGIHQMMLNIMDGKQADLSGVSYEFHELINLCMSQAQDQRPHANQLHQHLKVMPQSQMASTLFLPEQVQTAIKVREKEAVRTALHVKAMKPIPRPRKRGESNRDWEKRNRTYLKEMEQWRKAERKRRREAHKAKRRVPLTVKLLALLVVAGLTYHFWPQLPGIWDKVKKHLPVDKAEAAPGEQLPEGKPSVVLPGAAFAVGKPGQTYDPDNKGSSIDVTKVEAKGYQVTASVEVKGFADHGDMPFSDSCAKVRSGRSTVTVYPTSYQIGGTKDGVRTGSIVFSSVFQGSYTFYPECNVDKSVRPVTLGSARNVNHGTMHYQNTVVPVMGARTAGQNLVISVIPDEHGGSQFCLYSPGRTVRPSGIQKAHIGDIVFTELTFKGMAKSKGTLYPTCSEKNHNVTVHGGGVRIK